MAHSHRTYLRNEKFRTWFDHGDDGDSGWSIWSRDGISKHRGVPIFNNAASAVSGLQNLIKRQQTRPNPDLERIEKVDAVLRFIMRRPVSQQKPDDEETLTFAGSNYTRQHERGQWQQHQDNWSQWQDAGASEWDYSAQNDAGGRRWRRWEEDQDESQGWAEDWHDWSRRDV